MSLVGCFVFNDISLSTSHGSIVILKRGTLDYWVGIQRLLLLVLLLG
jgi:hypothetical protein